MKLLGIDIGGTKTSFCIGDEEGNILSSKRVATKDFQADVKRLIAESKKMDNDYEAIGISAPGPLSVSEGKLLTPPNLPGWEHMPIVKEVEDALSKPVFFNNDANCQALAEFHFGKRKNTHNLIYLTCSTGMGGGVIVDGKLVQGITDTAGEVGHFVLDIKGPPCPCGQRGCFEIFCGGFHLARKMQREIAKGRGEALLKEAGGKSEDVDIIHLEKTLRKNDPLSMEIWEEFIERLAQGIGILLMSFNPEVIILGTIAYHMKDLLFDPLKKALPRYAWEMPLSKCAIEASEIGDKLSELSSLAVALQFVKK